MPKTSEPGDDERGGGAITLAQGDVFIVWRVDFDSMENREPLSREIVGYAATPEAAGDAAKALFDDGPKYEGRRGGWGGERTFYPKFEVQKVSPLPVPSVLPVEEDGGLEHDPESPIPHPTVPLGSGPTEFCNECSNRRTISVSMRRVPCPSCRPSAPTPAPVTGMEPGRRCTALAGHIHPDPADGRGVPHLWRKQTEDWWADRPGRDRCTYVEPPHPSRGRTP